MERSKGITQTEKVLLRFNRIPRLGIQISLRKTTKQTPTNLAARLKRAEKQQISELFLQETYRMLRTPR